MRFLYCIWLISAVYYLGEPDELGEADEPPFHRIFGFQSEEEWRNLRNGSPETLASRIAPVLDQLLAKFGVTQNDDLDRRIEASKQMVAGLSEPYKEQLQKAVRWGKVEWPIEFGQHALGFGSGQ
jgi:hypothetical protein